MRSSFLMISVALTFILGTLSAQLPCNIGDDGFNLGCCQPAQPNIPAFPPVQTQAVYACMQNCLPQVRNAGVFISAPQMIFCDYAVANISVTLASGETITGALLLKYSRTWREVGVTGAPGQVWRFLVNGDLIYTTTGIGGIVCPVPPCALPPTNLPVHFVGHIDYACSPSVGTGFSVSYSLTHLPGCLSHAAFSTVPLVGPPAHTGVSYHLVGPAPFVFGPGVEPTGPLVDEGLRSSSLSFTAAGINYACRSEAELQDGVLLTQFSDCLCTASLPVVGPWKHQEMHGRVCCAGTVTPFDTVPLPGTPLPTGLLALTLGSWPPVVPGLAPKDLIIYVGIVQYSDPCPTTSPSFAIHAVTGVATTGTMITNFPPVNPSFCGPVILPVPRTAIDLQNMLPLSTLSLGLGTPIPGIGSLFASTLVFNLNTP